MRRRALLSSKVVYHGAGTENDPFLIYDIQDLIKFKNVSAKEDSRVHTDYYGVFVNVGAANQYFKLMNDIDVSSVCGSGIGNFVDTGDGLLITFSGTFDGNNHTISNIYDYYSTVSQTEYSKTCGFIYSLTVTGHIKNLIISNITAIGRYAGGIASICRGTISHCKNLSGTISGWQAFGGICGMLEGNGVVSHCENYANVIRSSWGHYYSLAGGISGQVGPAGTVEYCINFADLNFPGNSSNYAVGGISGGYIINTNNTSYVTNNINLGNYYSNSTRTGAIIGNPSKIVIKGNMQAGVFSNTVGQSGAICGYNNTTSSVYGNLNVGITNSLSTGSTSSSNYISPINYAGSNSANYPNYFITELNRYTATKTGVIASTSSNLICTADNTRPSAITNNTYWTTTNFVFKNGYYPYPKGIENTDACLCAATPVILASSNTYRTVSGTVQLGTIESYLDGITWTTSSSSIMRIDVAHDNSSEMDYYVGVPISTGQVTLTNWRNGKAYKKVNLTITGTV